MECTLKELEALSYRISKKIKKGHSIYLHGNLGSGKTAFTKLLIGNFFKSHNKKQPLVTSPTFNIVQYYLVNSKLMIAHYDLYRIKNKKDLDHIGLYELESQVISIIEWPELIKKKNKNRIEIKLEHTNFKNKRDVKTKYFGKIKK